MDDFLSFPYFSQFLSAFVHIADLEHWHHYFPHHHVHVLPLQFSQVLYPCFAQHFGLAIQVILHFVQNSPLVHSLLHQNFLLSLHTAQFHSLYHFAQKNLLQVSPAMFYYFSSSSHCTCGTYRHGHHFLPKLYSHQNPSQNQDRAILFVFENKLCLLFHSYIQHTFVFCASMLDLSSHYSQLL